MKYYIKDFTNAQAFVVNRRDKKEESTVATFYYTDQAVPKHIVRRAVRVFKNDMNDLFNNSKP